MLYETKPLGEVCDIIGGGTPSREKPEYFTGEVPWATPTDITALNGKKFITDTKEHITQNAIENSSTRLIPAGSVLMTSRATIGYTAINERPMCTNQGFASFVPNSEVYNLYLAYYLESIRDLLIQRAGGTTFKEISKSELRKTSIPIPPLKEQTMIASNLQKVNNAIERDNRVLQISKSYPLSLLNKMFTSMKTDEPQIVQLKEVCDIFDRDHRTPAYTEDGIPLISPANFVPEGINIENVKHISRGDFEVEKRKCNPKKGDILFSRIGTIGEVRYAPDIDFIPLHSIAVIRAHPERISHVYLYYVLQTDDVINQAFAGVQSIGVPDLGLKKIENIEIPLPSLVNQERFAKYMRAFESIRKRQIQSAEKLDLLFASLSNKYFNIS